MSNGISSTNTSFSRVIKPLLVLLVLISVFLGVKLLNTNKDLAEAEEHLERREGSVAILSFTGMFIKDVLNTKEEVSFEKRLQLENAVRELNNEEILIQWKKFSGSQTGDEAQNEAKILLEMLVDTSYTYSKIE